MFDRAIILPKWKIHVKTLGLPQIICMHDLHDYLSPVHVNGILEDESLTDGQIGKHIQVFEDTMPDLENVNIVLLGVPEYRGQLMNNKGSEGPDIIRKKLYRLHYWHQDVALADVGNIKTGMTLNDTYAAIKTVVSELIQNGKTVLLLGGSHDITLAQYGAYRSLERTVEVTCVDAAVDLHGESALRSENFLLDLLTGEPNLVKHYNHMAFQSYFVHPRMMETLNKLHFDCFRVGMVQELIEEMEPPIRHTDMMSVDIQAIKNSDSPASKLSPNGLTGAEACTLVRYAGMSHKISSLGIYGYRPEDDPQELSALQIAQMIWYFIDGFHKKKQDVLPDETHDFIVFHTAFAQVETTFLQSKRSNRWWMKMPDGKWMACSYKDYVEASSNQIPERWLRLQERDCQ